MGHWLAKAGDARVFSHIKRFDPRFWTVNFPRPMMAGVTTSGPQAMRVDAVFYRKDDLAGLIWEAEDRWDHPLVAYATRRDFRGCRLSFRWRSAGVRALDLTHGPTLTIEGREPGGAARSWFVRLWNYAGGTPEDAVVSLDFDAMDGGFELPGEGDPVWAGDVDRMFISLVAPGYTEADEPLAAPAEGWAEISEIVCEGAGSTIPIGETMVPAHELRIATGYDDCYNQTPARVLRNALLLGYRGVINHYVGMSHYYRLGGDGLATAIGRALNAPCAAWHADYAARATALGYDLILSLSYELFDAVCPEGWKQRDLDGAPALTGWEPPSTLLSPANVEAMGYLEAVALAFVVIAQGADQPVRFQIGEPWWWIFGDGRICLYDDAALAAFGENAVPIPDIRAPLDPGQIALLDRAGELLADSTAAFDDSSKGMTGTPGAGDQALGVGDGVETRFALVKRYGEEAGEEQVRAITRPVAGSVRVSVDGVELMTGWAVEEGGVVALDVAPDEGAEVRAGFRLDVPVRFAEDRLEVSRATFLAGEVASVPLVEVRE